MAGVVGGAGRAGRVTSPARTAGVLWRYGRAVSEPLHFTYAETKDGRVRIAADGRVVTTLAGREAQRFLARAAATDDEGRWQLMARATGNFKHGNERRSS